MTEYSPLIGNKKAEDYFSVKSITVTNTGKTKRQLYVVADNAEFPKKTFKNDLFELIFYFASDEIVEKAESEFKDIIQKQQEDLNYLLWGKNSEYPQSDFSLIEKLKLIGARDKIKKKWEESDKNRNNNINKRELLLKKAQDAIANTYKEIQKSITTEITKKRLELIKNLPSKKINDITKALQIYIGNYAFRILEFACNTVVFHEKSSDHDAIKFEADFKNAYLKQLIEGTDEKNIFTLAPQGGIKPFMNFIKERDETTYKNLNDYIEKTLELVFKPFTLTSKQIEDLFDIEIERDNKKIDDENIAQSKFIKDITSQNIGFSKIFQNNPLNAVAHTSQKNLKLNNSIMKATNKKYDVQVTLSLEKLPNLNLNVPAHKVLDSLMLKLTKQLPSGESISLEKIHRARKVSLTVNEYMTLCGIKDRTTARKQLSEAVNTIYNLSLDWQEKRYTIPEGKKKKALEEKTYSIRILDGKSETISENPVKNGTVEVNFTFEIAEYLARHSSFIMWYSEDILKINSKLNPHSYYMMRLFLEHNNRNIAGKNATRVSVKTLVDACPDLPKYDDVMEKYKGHITQTIIEPFERDLNALVEKYHLLNKWEYCNSNSVPLTEKQLSKYDYDTWIEWLIEFELPDNFPDQTERINRIKSPKW